MKIGQIASGQNNVNMSSSDQQVKYAENTTNVSATETKPNKVENVAKSLDNEKEDEVVDNEEVMKRSIEQANKSLEGYNRRIERTVHSVTHTIMYTIKDTKTDEIIAEFPPKKIQDMVAKMWELAGLFVDERG